MDERKSRCGQLLDQFPVDGAKKTVFMNEKDFTLEIPREIHTRNSKDF